MSLKYLCKHCGYTTNRKWSFEDHCSRPSACEKRLKRQHESDPCQKVNAICQNVNGTSQKVNAICQNVNAECQIVNVNNKNQHICYSCNKILANKRNLERHQKTCKGIDSLQCPKCKKTFSSKEGKYQHMKNVKCELVLTEEQQRIKDLEEQSRDLKQQLEESEAKRIEAENKCKTTVNNNYNITNNNNNNYFDHSINYNNYDNLNVDHITKEDIKRLFNNCRMQYPELSEDLTRMILSLKENQCIYLPEGQKSNTCAVIKDGVEMRKPLIRVLMDLGVQTATLIRDSNVIVRNKKDIVNNQFWADNRNACGLNISDIEYMTDNDKEIVQRNKNIVLDMGEGKI